MIPSEHLQVAKMSIHRMYELMGLVNMAAVQNKIVGHEPTAENQAWWVEAAASGVKNALPSRNQGFDDDIARLQNDGEGGITLSCADCPSQDGPGCLEEPEIRPPR